jgi:hypothetical protein
MTSTLELHVSYRLEGLGSWNIRSPDGRELMRDPGLVGEDILSGDYPLHSTGRGYRRLIARCHQGTPAEQKGGVPSASGKR